MGMEYEKFEERHQILDARINKQGIPEQKVAPCHLEETSTGWVAVADFSKQRWEPITKRED